MFDSETAPLPVQHTTFVITRNLPASPRHAFRFWAEPDLKKRWNDCHADWEVLEEFCDFKVGGAERKRWRMPDGAEMSFQGFYLDIVPSERIIYAFEMSFGDQRMSASLATVEFTASGKGSVMTFTEQIAYLGDAEGLRQRIEGTGAGFNKYVEALVAVSA
jgi:uncharacterized protein YndB with AHSA1/START domain